MNVGPPHLTIFRRHCHCQLKDNFVWYAILFLSVFQYLFHEKVIDKTHGDVTDLQMNWRVDYPMESDASYAWLPFLSVLLACRFSLEMQISSFCHYSFI